VYMMHWFVVIPWVMLKLALLPKSLVWQKTIHAGAAAAAPTITPYSEFAMEVPVQGLELEDDVVVSPEG
ncbi:MAG: hypothetical protein ACK549_14490, partial [Cyanobacteriota bacterium]